MKLDRGGIQKRLSNLSGRGWTSTPFGPGQYGAIFEEALKLRINNDILDDEHAKRIAAGKMPKFAIGTQLEFLNRRVVVTLGPTGPVPDDIWLHASISLQERMPTYEDLVMLHKAVWQDDGWSYQAFAPKSAHVNIHEFTLHLWGRPDGRPELPNFGAAGSI